VPGARPKKPFSTSGRFFFDADDREKILALFDFPQARSLALKARLHRKPVKLMLSCFNYS
jgi:hypothetical protein